MARRDLKYVTVLGNKGINQQEKLANPETELADARNLWAPNGRVEKRPGYWGIGSVLRSTESTNTLTGITTLSEDASHVFTETETLSDKPVNTWWYWGWSETIDDATYPLGLGYAAAAGLANSNENSFKAEYWNGDGWAPLYAAEYNSSTAALATSHLGSTDRRFYFPWPRDWALSTINGNNFYWVRFTVLAMNGSTALDASVTVRDPAAILSGTLCKIRYQIVAQFPDAMRYVTYVADETNNIATVQNYGQIAGPESDVEYVTLGTSIIPENEPASVAVVPQFNEFYTAYGQQVLVHKAKPLIAADSAALATVETDAILVGSGKRYDSALIPQLGSWPEAKYIAFHRGEMWAANLKDGGATSIRWSAAAPAYKVWPQINIDVLSDIDQGPITGIYPFNQNMFVGKSDAIWQMVYTGLNGDSLNTYRAEKVVAGVGWVSQNSIQDINGRLVFLAEDGIYSYDGARLRKLSDRIQKTIDSISQGKRAFAVSAHWRSKSCYLLAVTTQGAATNNLVIVWDYKNDSFWLWNNIAATTFFTTEDSADVEHIYFTDLGGRIFELGVGHHDYGTAVTAYGITQRLGTPNVTKKLRLVDISSTNSSSALTVEVQRNDAPFTAATTSTLTLSDSLEDVYGTGLYGTATYVGERDRDDGIGVLLAGESFRVKFSHSAKNSPFVMNELRAGLLPVGVRE